MKYRFAFLSLLALALLLPFTAPAHADDSQVIFGTSVSAYDTHRPDPEDTMIYGSVFISHSGTMKVIWDSVQVNGGSYGIGTNDGRTYHWNVTMPAVILDLQKVFGLNWMKAIKLNISSAGYDDDPARNTVDTYIGKVMLNLTQTVYSDKKFSLEVTESAGAAGFYSRYYDQTGQTAESVPFYFQLNTTAVEKITPDVVVALSIGTYATIFDKLNGPNEDRFGGYVNPELRIGKAFTTGVRAEAMERLLFKTSTVYQTMVQTSAYVKYVLSHPGSRVQHAIQINIGQVYDESIPVEGGKPLNNYFAKLQYTVAF